MIVRLKDVSTCTAHAGRKGFNSMIVRLKERQLPFVSLHTWFQFYDSPIKSKTLQHPRASDLRFNSMIVRLKELRNHATTFTKKFQFYDSPIKSERSTLYCAFEAGFQFYDSPIKSVTCGINSYAKSTFQFYDSPIKSTLIGVVVAKVRSFNSMIVRLKECRRIL